MKEQVVVFFKSKKEEGVICRIDGGKIGFIDRRYSGVSPPKDGEKWAVEIKKELNKFSIVWPLFKIDPDTAIEELLKLSEFYPKLDCFNNEFIIYEKDQYGRSKEFKRIPYDGRWDGKELHSSLSTEEILEVHKKVLSFRRRVADRNPELGKVYGENYSDTYVFKRGEKVYGLILDPIDSSRGRGKRDHAFLVNYAPIIEFFPQDIESWGMYIFETPELRERIQKEEEKMKEEREVDIAQVGVLYREFAQLNADAGEWHSEDIAEFFSNFGESQKTFCSWLNVRIEPGQEEDFWRVLSRLMILDYVSWEILRYEGDPITEELPQMSKEEFVKKLLNLSLFKFFDSGTRQEFLGDLEEIAAEITSSRGFKLANRYF